MNEDIETQLRQFISKNLLFTEEPGGIDDEVSLLAAGIIDSTGIMELVEFVSSQFGLEVPMKDINQKNFDSIRCLADYVRRCLKTPENAGYAQVSAKTLSLPPT